MNLKIETFNMDIIDFNIYDESGNANLTQEQIDELMEEHRRSMEEWVKEMCTHKWEKYVGFTNVDRYCIYCLKKENID